MSQRVICSLLFLLILGASLQSGYQSRSAPTRLIDNLGSEDGVKEKKQVILVFAGGISLADLCSVKTPGFQRLLSQGSLGIMNVRTGGSFTPENAYATFGANDRAVGSLQAGYVFKAKTPLEESTAGEIFLQRTGTLAPADSLVVLDYPRLLKNNLRSNAQTAIGALGEALTAAGNGVAVIGNADTDSPGREVALVLMNRAGYIQSGEVEEEINKADPKSPYGLKTDYTQLFSYAQYFMGKVDCLGVETGETSRLEKYRDLLLPNQMKKKKEEAIKDLDGFLDRLLQAINLKKTSVFFLSSFPSRDAQEKGDVLQPVVAIGSGFSPGLLYSPSARRPGIITLFDLQATILSTLGVPAPSGFQGRPLSTNGHPDPVGYLSTTNERIIRVNLLRAPVLKGFVLVQVILLFLSLLAILLRPTNERLTAILRSTLIGIIIVPLALLLEPVLQISSLAGVIVYLMIAVVLTGWLSTRQNLAAPRLSGIISLLTSLLILVDLFRGSPLMMESILGFSPVGGARYYGIGNEYMGILLGASATGISAFLDWIGRSLYTVWVAILLFGIWSYATVAPWLGSNLGGGISLIVTYLVLIWLLKSPQSRRGRIILAFALIGAVLFVTLLGLLDSFRPPEVQSHMGRLVWAIRNEGLSVLAPIIFRKIRMNLTLIEYTIWSKALLTFLLALGIIFYHPRGKPGEFARRYPGFFLGFWSAVVGGIVALVVNDSGIVAAATALLYPVMTMTSLALEAGLPPKGNV